MRLIKTINNSVLLVFVLPLFLIMKANAQSSKEKKVENRIFKAGASTSNITPYLGTLLVGAFKPTPAMNIHDELHVRSLVLDNGENKLIFVVTDLLMIERKAMDSAKKIINVQTGIPIKNILISAVHNHYGPSAEGKDRKDWNYYKPLDNYQKFLVHRIVDGVQVALNHLEPARIGWGVVKAPENVFNRRWVMKDPYMDPFGEMDKVKFNPGRGNPGALRPAGPTDPDVSFISVQSSSGRPIALLANYSLHYVGGIPKGDVSADYFAAFADRVQQLIGADRQNPPFVGIMTNGTSGDINNINVRGKRVKYAPYEKIHIVADDVAQKVYKEYKNLKYFYWVPLNAELSELKLGVRKPSNEGIMSAVKKVLKRPESEEPLYNRHERSFAKRAMQLEENWPDSINVPIQAFRIGKLGIAAAPFEVFAETGLEIKARSPFKTTFTIELANGAYGYLPTPRQHKLGGYETWMGSNKVEKNTTIKMVKRILSLFSDLEQK